MVTPLGANLIMEMDYLSCPHMQILMLAKGQEAQNLLTVASFSS